MFVEQGQRRIPVQFAKRVVGRRMYGGQSTYIPLKVNQCRRHPDHLRQLGALPAAAAVVRAARPTDWAPDRAGLRQQLRGQADSTVHLVFFGLLIIGFAYFYTAITFDPAKQADTIRKQGGFIPGIRPGPQTERYLAKILSRITLPGALFIAARRPGPVAAADASSSPGNQVSFSGISILIAVGVALETMKQIDSQLMMRNYEGFLK